ncbi:MAG: ABC transporter permease [Bauldia sp.]
MRKVLAIAGIALLRFIRDRGNLFFVFILPLGIVILIGAQFGGGEGVRFAVVAPAGTTIGDAFVAALEADDAVAVARIADRAEAVSRVEQGSAAIAIVIPGDVDAQVAAGTAVPVEVIGPAGGAAAQYGAIITEAMGEATARSVAIRFVTGRGAARAAAETAVNTAFAAVPVIGVENAVEGESPFEGVSSQFQIPATSQLLLFMFLTGLAASAALIQARNLGVTRRMLGTPTSAATLITGEATGRLLVSLAQGLYIVAATTLIFQIDWGNLLGAAAIILLFAAVAAGGAMLFGTLFRSDQIASIVGVISGLGLAALGGCMLPLELFGPTLSTIAHFTPHAWALDAFAEIQRRGGTILDILPELGVLAAFAIVLLALAAWRMRATLGKGTVRE